MIAKEVINALKTLELKTVVKLTNGFLRLIKVNTVMVIFFSACVPQIFEMLPKGLAKQLP